MKINNFFIFSAFFQTCFPKNLLRPDTLLLSEGLSQFDKCTIIVLTSKLDLYDYSPKEKDASFEIEPLKVSITFIHKVYISNMKQSQKTTFQTIKEYLCLFNLLMFFELEPRHNSFHGEIRTNSRKI